MDSVLNVKINIPEDHDHQPPRPKSKQRFIFYSIIIVFATISALASCISHLKKPSFATRISCSVTNDHHLCFTSISSLQNTNSTSSNSEPSKIFQLSLQVGMNYLTKLTPSLQLHISKTKNSWTISALRNCKNHLNHSQRLLNSSLSLIGENPNQKILMETNISSYLSEKIMDARENVDSCRMGLSLTELYENPRNEVKMNLDEAWMYVDNSLMMFHYIDDIEKELNSTVESVLRSLIW